MILITGRLHKLLILLLISAHCSSQTARPGHYPKDYFRWPLEQEPSIVANFGELRPDHYHMGFDCRTSQKTNQPVLAAATGYISRIKIEPFGFGRSIYINHPNGLTTIYAHLNDFYPELEKQVKEQQYKLKSWKLDLSFPDSLFPVKKDMFIAYSGNTGGSQGPHLHFEIRDTKTDKNLNPGLFGFAIPDTIPPDIFRLAVYDRRVSTYEQEPELYTFKKLNGVYVTTPPLIIAGSDKISLGIMAADRCTGSSNRNGVYETELYDNGNRLISFRLDSISYDETRYFNAHIDHRLRSRGGPYIQHLSGLPGYINSIYNPPGADGLIRFTDSSIHKIRILVKDTDGNISTAEFGIKPDSNLIPAPKNGSPELFDPKEFHPGFINVYENDNIFFYLPENCLYDSIRFRYSEVISASGYNIHTLHNVSVPLHSRFPVSIKGSSALPDKMVIHRFANGRNDYEKAEPVMHGKEKGWFRARFRGLGSFQLMPDTVPPKISPLGFKDRMNCSKLNRIRFVITDNTGDIENFTALLDGNWLRFSNDKGRVFIYDFDEMCPPGEHELKISVEDRVGNRTEKVYHFTR